MTEKQPNSAPEPKWQRRVGWPALRAWMLDDFVTAGKFTISPGLAEDWDVDPGVYTKSSRRVSWAPLPEPLEEPCDES
ncbi:MAG: hypothetical protein GY716_15915 [bacterium]|nr:hypothetical protein [bacterium]